MGYGMGFKMGRVEKGRVEKRKGLVKRERERER
jgi:hypothetical protein